MKLKSTWADFEACVVETKSGTHSSIPADRYAVIENQTAGGGVTIFAKGIHIDINYVEWTRLIAEGFVKDI